MRCLRDLMLPQRYRYGFLFFSLGYLTRVGNRSGTIHEIVKIIKLFLDVDGDYFLGKIVQGRFLNASNKSCVALVIGFRPSGDQAGCPTSNTLSVTS